MLKKSLIIFSFLLLANPAFAITCPTPTEIKATNLQGWTAYDINNGIPASSLQLNIFENLITTFALAEWQEDAPEGAAHCYYYGNDHNPDYLGIFLAKPNLAPDDQATAWRNVGKYDKQCNATLDECRFQDK